METPSHNNKQARVEWEERIGQRTGEDAQGRGVKTGLAPPDGLRSESGAGQVTLHWQLVEGAVGMVEMALSRLTEKGVVELDEERTASMVSNLMVVLCGDQPPSPVVNAGTLYP